MGKEQGTDVSGSIIDTPPIADLTDPRLPRTFKAWNHFKNTHIVQIERIGSLKAKEVVILAEDLSATMSEVIGIGNETTKFTPASEERIVRLKEIISGEGNRVIFMRHGEQSPPEWISSLPNPALRKIRMMQDPFNRQDLLTNNGLVDVFVTGLVLLFVSKAAGKRTRIFSSENLRAKEVAYIFSTIIPASGLSTLEGLSCITYKDEAEQPPVSEEMLLTDLPSGLMPWEPNLVDALCKRPKSGINPSELIISTISGFIDYGKRGNGNKIAVILTHNQQIAEVLRESDKLGDPSVRFPELTMLVSSKGNLTILPKGVLGERKAHSKAKQLRKILETKGAGYDWYSIRGEQYATDLKIPFLVSPEPLYLSQAEAIEISSIGEDISSYLHAAHELYQSEEEVRKPLDLGKPDFLKGKIDINYLFLRPDLLLTENGFSLCEIETSPFGLALAELINQSFIVAGYDTLVEEDVLEKFIKANTPSSGSIVYSAHGRSYEGQLQFLADQVFSGEGRFWNAQQSEYVPYKPNSAYYRAFYIYEGLEDLFVNNLVGKTLDNGNLVIPSYTPHVEEKALLSFIWDRRWEDILKRRLGQGTFNHLRQIIPITWILGEEKYVDGALSVDSLVGLSNAKRKFVLKKSGFGEGSSWSKGVSFLQEKSAEVTAKLLEKAQNSDSLYIVQEFRKSKERCMIGDGADGLHEMAARIRLTPYFSFVKGSEGNLIAIKATGCEKTNYIHGSTASINTAVSVA